MTKPWRTIPWLLLAIGMAVLTTLVVESAMQEIEAVDDEAPATTVASAEPSAGETEVAALPTTTTIPEIESLIPLSVEAIEEDVARSVGFVLSQQGTGSGVIIGEDLLVTNAHVAWPDRTVSVVFTNGATVQGRVIALDPFVDLAVVDISTLTRQPPPISIGSLSDVEIGDELYVVGYPAPDEFTPEPTIDSGDLLGVTDWEFSGVGWFSIEAPAIGGQSGGAVVDEYGRLVGISTFGSTEQLTSISIDDVVAEVDRLLADESVRGLDRRLIPHSGARRSNDVELDGVWDQELLFGWFLADAEVSIDWVGGSGELVASLIDGTPIAGGDGAVDFVPGFAFPVVVAAESEAATAGTLDSSLPLIRYEDPDHGKQLETSGEMPGVFEVGGDRDFFYLSLNAGDEVRIIVESAARTALNVYGPDGSRVAKDADLSGFIGNSAATRVTASEAGTYVVAVESTDATVAGYAIITR